MAKMEKWLHKLSFISLVILVYLVIFMKKTVRDVETEKVGGPDLKVSCQ